MLPRAKGTREAVRDRLVQSSDYSRDKSHTRFFSFPLLFFRNNICYFDYRRSTRLIREKKITRLIRNKRHATLTEASTWYTIYRRKIIHPTKVDPVKQTWVSCLIWTSVTKPWVSLVARWKKVKKRTVPLEPISPLFNNVCTLLPKIYRESQSLLSSRLNLAQLNIYFTFGFRVLGNEK